MNNFICCFINRPIHRILWYWKNPYPIKNDETFLFPLQITGSQTFERNPWATNNDQAFRDLTKVRRTFSVNYRVLWIRISFVIALSSELLHYDWIFHNFIVIASTFLLFLMFFFISFPTIFLLPQSLTSWLFAERWTRQTSKISLLFVFSDNNWLTLENQVLWFTIQSITLDISGKFAWNVVVTSLSPLW